MVTIFDMVTGEVIDEQTPALTAHATASTSCPARELLAPRLQVLEPTLEPAKRRMPADLAVMDAAAFVASQRS